MTCGTRRLKRLKEKEKRKDQAAWLTGLKGQGRLSQPNDWRLGLADRLGLGGLARTMAHGSARVTARRLVRPGGLKAKPRPNGSLLLSLSLTGWAHGAVLSPTTDRQGPPVSGGGICCGRSDPMWLSCVAKCVWVREAACVRGIDAARVFDEMSPMSKVRRARRHGGERGCCVTARHGGGSARVAGPKGRAFGRCGA